jgi:hypothetical protein
MNGPMHQGEELKDTLMGEINARLQQLITESPVVLFMKVGFRRL